MTNGNVEQMLQDLQRGLNNRNLAHREQISNVMVAMDTAIVRYTESLTNIIEAMARIAEEQNRAYRTFKEELAHQSATLLLLRDMHPVLLEEPVKQIEQTQTPAN